MALKNVKSQAATKAFGKAMRQHRNKLGLSQEALADRAQLDRSYMSQIERGIKNVTLNSIWRIAEALEVGPSDLLRLTEDLFSGRSPVPLEGAAVADVAIARSRGPVSLATPVTIQASAQGAPSDWQRPMGALGKPTALICSVRKECADLERMLQHGGWQTVRVHSSNEATLLLSNIRTDVVLADTDLLLNGGSPDFLEAVQERQPKLPLFFLTGDAVLSQDEVKTNGGVGMIRLAADEHSLMTTLRSALPR